MGGPSSRQTGSLKYLSICCCCCIFSSKCSKSTRESSSRAIQFGVSSRRGLNLLTWERERNEEQSFSLLFPLLPLLPPLLYTDTLSEMRLFLPSFFFHSNSVRAQLDSTVYARLCLSKLWQTLMSIKWMDELSVLRCVWKWKCGKEEEEEESYCSARIQDCPNSARENLRIFSSFSAVQLLLFTQREPDWPN